ncbi:hypothetical protein CF394_06890 [Tetzosporium hominis]|uniref:ECF transporter S component n=1 Tax=Tetzosporium hominis TaxID=2020506 RepID=A0A264W4G5_9BACL|nr:ECF transporter S component [Tetzosporium hominis]OZS78476.1 hypothetical protein CF394_06890 [Tetzosporium hominis]
MGVTRNVTLAALFIALCGIGALLKIPGPFSSVALDLAPALISTLFLGPVWAGVIAALGHLISAFTGGLPLGPFHAIVAVEMFVIVSVFGLIIKRGWRFVGFLFVTLATGLLAPLPFYFLISPALYMTLVPVLLVATAINSVVAWVALPFLKRIKPREVVR